MKVNSLETKKSAKDVAKDLTNCCEVSRLLVASLPKSYSLSAVSRITFEKLYADERGNFCIEAISDETVFRANVRRVNTSLVTSTFHRPRRVSSKNEVTR